MSIPGTPSERRFSVLVTGGAGFIGTHLCRALVRDGYSVTVLDLVSPRAPVLGVQYLQGDVSSAADVRSSLSDPAIGAVFHFAAVSSVPVCEDDPVRSYRTNLMGTATLLEEIRQVKKSTGRDLRVVFSGSSAVYGALGESGNPLEESLSVPFPLSNYGIQKLAAERLFRSFHLTAGIQAIVFRFFNVYGPGQDPSSPYTGVITAFSSRLESKQPIQLHGGGLQTRDFISVQDVVGACLNALLLPAPSCDGQPINLGSGRRITIRDLAQLMIQITGCDVPLYVTESRTGDVAHSLGNISRAQSLLGWMPQVGLEVGLKSVLEGSLIGSA